MPFFDYYIMVDWSGGNQRNANAANCIWIAHGVVNAETPDCESLPSRNEATSRVQELVVENGENGRVLACFDFAFGFPRGFAGHLPDNGNDQLWAKLWEYLHANLADDLHTQPGHVPSNRSNRFDVANALNQLIGGNAMLGPFWCADPNWLAQMQMAGDAVFIPNNKPANFTNLHGIAIPPYRHVDVLAEADFPFRLFGHGSVGSQILTGIPRLHQLRHSPNIAELGGCLVWPFETGWWTAEAEDWPGDNVNLILAEIYPSVQPPLDDEINDRGQVRAMWQWARDLDAHDELLPRFCQPDGLNANAELIARCEEGWILR